MCEVLEVSRSGYYAWLDRPPSKRELHHQELLIKIKEFFNDSRNTYGAIRIAEDFYDEGVSVGKNTIARLMRKHGIIPKTTKKFRLTTKSKNTVAHPNYLKQNFKVEKANQKWVTDITFIPTREGFVYLSAILDLHSKVVVGWSMSHRMNRDLVTDSLKMALDDRKPDAGLIIHSDRGCQYGSDAYQRMLKHNGLICSMSRKGNCWDNAVAESFFHSLKTEEVMHDNYQNRSQAKMRVFDYIEIFYNRKRRHSSLGYVAPLVYEEQENK